MYFFPSPTKYQSSLKICLLKQEYKVSFPWQKLVLLLVNVKPFFVIWYIMFFNYCVFVCVLLFFFHKK